jgi:hypothetical protein
MRLNITLDWNVSESLEGCKGKGALLSLGGPVSLCGYEPEIHCSELLESAPSVAF